MRSKESVNLLVELGFVLGLLGVSKIPARSVQVTRLAIHPDAAD